jgi:CheY-like chemotaxis protein
VSARERRTILYIEDHLSNLTLVQRIFTRNPNLHIIPAMQGRMGLELAREHCPDLILLDLHLPDMSGHQVMVALRDDPVLAEIPVVVISADATPGEIARLRAAGARDYVTKPFEVGRLVGAVAEALNEQEVV